MKLLHKLIPVAALTGLATVVTPIITSCGNNHGGEDEPTEIGTWTKGQTYVPMTPHKEQQITTNEDLTKLYHESISAKESKVFEDDFVYWTSQDNLASSGLAISFDVDEIKSSLTNVKDPETLGSELVFRVSFKVELTAKAKAVSDTKVESNLEYDKVALAFANIPLTCDYKSNNGETLVRIRMANLEEMTKDETWQISMPELVVDDKNQITLGDAKNYCCKDIPVAIGQGIGAAVCDFASRFCEFESNYFIDIHK